MSSGSDVDNFLRSLLKVRTFVELAAELKVCIIQLYSPLDDNLKYLSFQGLSITVNALAAASDLIIAGTLTYLLQTSKTGFKRHA